MGNGVPNIIHFDFGSISEDSHPELESFHGVGPAPIVHIQRLDPRADRFGAQPESLDPFNLRGERPNVDIVPALLQLQGDAERRKQVPSGWGRVDQD
jgi:hypothetical protein